MAELIKRIGGKIVVGNKPIDIGSLVNAGTELLFVHPRSHGPDEVNFYRDIARKKAEGQAIELADKYKCQYAMVGNEAGYLCGDAGPNTWIFIATFFNVQ